MTPVTVLMPTYNRPHLVPQAVATVLEQSFPEWKLWILNDGGSPVAEMDDPRITVHDLPHGGKAAALNWAIPRLETPYVAYLDDDDRWLPHHLETALAALGGAVRAVYTDVIEVRLSTRGELLESWIDRSPDVRSHHLWLRNVVNHNALVHETALFSEIGGYDEDLPALIDWDMVKRIAACTRIAHVREATVEHRMVLAEGGAVAEGHITGLRFAQPAKYRKAFWRVFLKGFSARRALSSLPARGKARH